MLVSSHFLVSCGIFSLNIANLRVNTAVSCCVFVLGMLNSFLFKIQTLFVKFEFYSNFVYALKVTTVILHELKVIMAPYGLLIKLPRLFWNI